MSISVMEIVPLVFALVTGAGLGVLFFGGLWLTIQRLPQAQRPALLLLASLAVRLIITLGGFYVVMGGSGQRLVACIVGFFMVRLFLVRRLQPVRANPKTAQETGLEA